MPIVSVISGCLELQDKDQETIESTPVSVEENQQSCSILDYYKQANEISMTLFC